MKKPIIEKFYYGLDPKTELTPSKEYWDALDEVLAIDKNLTENFSKEQKELFEKYENCEVEIESQTALTHFREGFKLGVLLGLEISENNIKN